MKWNKNNNQDENDKIIRVYRSRMTNVCDDYVSESYLKQEMEQQQQQKTFNIPLDIFGESASLTETENNRT